MDVRHLTSDKRTLVRYLIKLNLLMLLVSLLSMPFDQRVSRAFSWEKTYNIYWTARHTTDIGLLQHYLIFSLLMYFYLAYFWPKWTLPKMTIEKYEFYKKWALNCFVALIVSGMWVHILKFTVGRQRPHITGPTNYPFTFHPLNWNVHYHSFPSGHSQVMFAVALLLTIVLPRQKWLWYLVAIYVCFTRVIVHDHFVSDTIFGACAGISGTLFSIYLMNRTKMGIYFSDRQ